MRTIRWAVLLATVSVAGCGGGDDGGDVAPVNSTIETDPVSWTYEPYNGNDIPLVLGPKFVAVTVRNENGGPVRGTKVTMFHSGDFSIMNSDADGNYRDFQLEPYVATTDDFGHVYVYLWTSPSNIVGSSRNDFEAYSGSAYEVMSISMTCNDVNTTTTEVCD